MKVTKSEREEAAATLRELCPAGSTVYGTIHSVSRSGMSRHMSLYVIEEVEATEEERLAGHLFGHRIRCIDRLACRVGCAGNYSESKEDIQISGCGLDLIHHAVSTLAYSLYGNEGKLRNERI